MSKYYYGLLFDLFFKSETFGLSHDEVPLFHIMKDCIEAALPSSHVDVYHGARSRVEFQANLSFNMRYNQCELSDLAIIVFSPSKNIARVTYFQAKSERSTVIAPSTHAFAANLLQWDLLSRRPDISGVFKTFQPPGDLLSGAVLKSVGTFGFFYKNAANDYEIFYSSADNLQQSSVSTQKSGTVRSSSKYRRFSNGFYERVWADNNVEFSSSLFNLEIGTPVQRGPVAKWLVQEIEKTLSGSVKSQNVIELLRVIKNIDASDMLNSIQNETDFSEKHSIKVGAKHLMIINSDLPKSASRLMV